MLSRLPKVISQHRPQPELLGEDTCLMQCFPGREVGEKLNEPLDLIINRGVLPVGTDLVLPSPPEVVHRVELGRPLWQPDQSDIQPGGQPLGASGGVAAVLI